MDMKIFEDVDSVCRFVAERMIALAESGENVSISLSGGSTPKRLFKMLTDEFSDVNWQNVHFYWGDDRCVPAESSESNYGEAKRLFFDFCKVPPENIHFVNGIVDPEVAAEDYSKEILDNVVQREDLPSFDLIILGMGNDGHTASIFPDRQDLWFSEKICEVAVHPESGQKRVSITGPVINNAKAVLFLCTGSGKKDMVATVVNGEDLSLPASQVAPVDGELIWCLDKDAAEYIS